MSEHLKSSHEPASAKKPIVCVIDDDVAVRTTLGSLFRSVGLRVELFGSAREFKQIEMPDVASCLVLDIRLPGVSGLDFQAELAEADIGIPVILITGHGDIPMSVRAMKAGAIDFLTKPFREQDILDAVTRAIDRDQKRRDGEKVVAELRILFELLDLTRARGDETGRCGTNEQTDRGRIGPRRDNREGPSWPSDAKNECALAGRLDRNGSPARYASPKSLTIIPKYRFRNSRYRFPNPNCDAICGWGDGDAAASGLRVEERSRCQSFR